MSKRFVFLACLLAAPWVHAEVVSVEVTDKQPWVGGQSFGAVGPYEVLRGTVRYAIDPRSASAGDVTDIQYAPTNARGLVEYSGPFVLIRPVDPTRGNHMTLVEVANRGRTQMDGVFFKAEGGLDLMAPNKIEALSDPTFFTLGYSLAWVSWQGRMKADEFGLKVPVAQVHGPVRATFAASDMDAERKAYDLTEGGFYCARDAKQRKAVLRLQTRFDDPGTVVSRKYWRFAAAPVDKTANARCGIALKHAAASGSHFSLVYEGEDAAVMGLGQAAFRDFANHLKSRAVLSEINNRLGDGAAVFAYGYSQGGRFLRDFLYRGFNTAPDGKRVFDGMLVTTAGAGRGSFNHRYALPGEAGNSVMSNLRAVDIYPFSDLPTPDVDGHGNAGQLDRALHDGTAPKIMYITGSSEYWSRINSLLQTSTDGKQAVELAPNSRLYFYSGSPHAPRRFSKFTEKATEASYPYNSNNDLADGLNAQLENLREWAVDDVAPPETMAPVVGSTLVPVSELAFPLIPGIRVPSNPPSLWQLDLGRDYLSKGILTEPPRIGARYLLLVPQVDSDGNELGGWRGAVSSVPLGTMTGWNWRNPENASFGFISANNGAFIPFARTRAERLAAKDPRPSIEERYGNREGFIAAAAVSIDRAIARRFLLPIQREKILADMSSYWDNVQKLEWYLGARAPTAKPVD